MPYNRMGNNIILYQRENLQLNEDTERLDPSNLRFSSKRTD